MKILQLIKEEVVPLSRRQNVVLLTIIACIFQFVLFYAPALADEAVKEAKAQEIGEEMIINNGSLKKEATMDPEAFKMKPDNSLATQSDELEDENDTAVSTVLAPEDKPIDKYKVVKTSVHKMTAYNSEVGQTDDSPCITANGFNVCKHGVEDTIAANFLPMGTKIRIPDLFGDRVFVVRDRMNKKHPNRVDVWMLHRADALKFGIRTAKIEILQEI